MSWSATGWSVPASATEGSRSTSSSPEPPSTSRWAKAASSCRGTTKAATMVNSVRALAFISLKAPSRMSPTVIGCSGRGPVRTPPPFGLGGGGGPHPHPHGGGGGPHGVWAPRWPPGGRSGAQTPGSAGGGGDGAGGEGSAPGGVQGRGCSSPAGASTRRCYVGGRGGLRRVDLRRALRRHLRRLVRRCLRRGRHRGGRRRHG